MSAYKFKWLRHCIGKATALQWKGNGFSMERQRHCNGKATRLQRKDKLPIKQRLTTQNNTKKKG